MALRLSLSLESARGGSSAPATIAAPFASVNGPLTGPSAGPYESWSVEYGSQPTISANVAFTVSRQGYTAAAATTTYLDTMYVVKSTSAGGAVRQPYPNQASQSATTAALSDYIYSTDTPSGSVTNNSTFISPKPVANWATPDRRLVGDTIGGDTLPVEIVAFHRNARNGKQVACVVFTISDGSTSIDVTVATPEVSTYPGDLHPVIVYKLPATSISTLNTGSITVNAKVYPWIGAAASVADSSTGTPTRREFSPRYFYHNATKFATPDIMYVATTGTDATAEVNDVAKPALTIIGAINRMRTGSTGAPWNTATTKIVILDAGTFTIGAGASGTSTGYAGGLVVTRDPGVSRAAAVIQTGASTFLPTIGAPAAPVNPCIIFTDVSMTRAGGAAAPFRGPDLEVQMDQVSFDCSTLTTTWWSTSSSGQAVSLFGTTITNNGAGGSWNAASTVQQRIWRGVTITTPGTTDAYLLLGNSITANGSSLVTAGSLTQDGMIHAFNLFGKITNTTFTSVVTAVPNGAAFVQNVYEYCSATGGNTLAVSHDGMTNSTSHVIIHNNTFAGFWSQGRNNLFYDEGATARTNKLQSVIGNIFTSIANKSDVFRGANEAGGDASTRLGNWGYLYGVGCFANFSQYIDGSSGGLGSAYAQAYPGPGSLIGTSSTTAQMATSNFTNFQASNSAGGTGAAGGTYSGTLATVKGIVTDAVLPYDLAGTARVTTADTAGAYVAP